MSLSFQEYNLEIIAEKFVLETGEQKTDKTVLVTFLDEKQQVKEERRYAFISRDFFLDARNPGILDFCYISPEVFSEVIQFLQNNPQTIKFSANNSFWEHPECLDFSGLTFNSDTLSFTNSVFAAKRIAFNKTAFRSQLVNFSDCNFFSDLCDFSQSHFKSEKIRFNNSLFSQGEKRFREMQIEHASVEFRNVEFTGGNISFSYTNFGKGPVSFKISRFGAGKTDFSHAIFGTLENSFEKADFNSGDLSFRSAVFNDGKVNFISCIFGQGEKSFVGTKFGNGDVLFKNSKFSGGKVRFRMAEFGNGQIDFHFSEFEEGDFLFDSVNIQNGDLDFRAVNFGRGKVRFKNLMVGDGNIIFENSQLQGDFIISDTVFGKGEFNFEDAVFDSADLIVRNVDFGTGKVSFKSGSFKSISLSSSQLDNYFDLRVKFCGFLDLSDTVIKDILNIDSQEFSCNIKKINLAGMRLLGRIYLDWRRLPVKQIICRQNADYAVKAEQFRILKENYNVTGQYDYEDEAYVQFKRAESKALLQSNLFEAPIHIKIWAYLKYGFKWLIFDKMGKYATDPLRVLLTMAVTYLLFTAAYLFVAEFGNIHISSSLFEEGDPRILSNIQKAFYHSAITFLTIGYGDYYPEGISRWISSFEGFMGLFLMSYFTVAFVRKVLR
jgi:hypothetical protein